MTLAGQRTVPPQADDGPPVDPWTDLLGGLLVRYPGLWTKLGDWETHVLNSRLEGSFVDRPIYIAGLARSGSTILLEELARHPDTATHRYRDFPMVLTPWAWNWFVDRAGQTEREATERAHRDRIKVTPESPEAFEEVLWMTFFPQLHGAASSAVLDEHTRNERFEAFYRDHIRKIIALRNAPRYLAKGNYNVTRLRYLQKIFPDALFLVPIRDPVWHIASLMKQHRLFAAAETRDVRVLHHMRRTGHFEFGLDRRPIHVGDDSAAEVARLWQEGEEVVGWATHWASVYGHIADVLEGPKVASATRVVRYEDLCADPVAVLAGVFDHCELADAGEPIDDARTRISAPDYYQPAFTADERRAIRERTAPVAARFGYG